MLSETKGNAARAANGSGFVALLAPQSVAQPLGLAERLLQKRAPIGLMLGERAVSFTLEDVPAKTDMLAIQVEIGEAVCQLHIPDDLSHWLQQPLNLSGRLVDEKPFQRALLLELACLDLCTKVETHLGQAVRFGEGKADKLPVATGIRLAAGDESFLCRLAMPKELAERLADALDAVQAPLPPDLSGHSVEVVVRAGGQELLPDELDSLRPGDIVMLESGRPSVVVEGKLAASVECKQNSVVLSSNFAPLPASAPVMSASGRGRKKALIPVSLVFEFGRIAMALDEVEALSPGSPLPLTLVDEDRVHIVRDGKRIGRGEIVKIGEGTGIRITHLPIAGSAAQKQVS